VNFWVTLFFGGCIGVLLTFAWLFLEFIKKENSKTQKIDNELKLILDKMSARDIYIHKISQNNLIWDKTTQTYIKKME
tara:strand:- start:365 stop:598 length:234 start_codon:yes stop_codon:yes gene_type:complete